MKLRPILPRLFYVKLFLTILYIIHLINEVASTVNSDIVSYCKTLPEMSWTPKIEEIERREMPEYIRTFLTKLMSGKEHATVNNENVKRLVNSFGSDIINGVMTGKILTKKYYLLSLGLHSMIGTRSVIAILNKLFHCLNYNKTCEIETAIAKSTFIRAKEKNILPILPVGDEIILTFFWTILMLILSLRKVAVQFTQRI